MALSAAVVRSYGKPLVFTVLLIPALWLSYNWWLAFQFQPHGLGFNPQETSNRFSGDWAMRILLLSLAITPLSTLLKSPMPIMFRRMIGLFAFFYVCLHITSYIWLDIAFNWPELWTDITKRIFITVGMAAVLLLLPLAVTSTKGWIKRLGARRWRRLHKFVYIAGPLVIIHFFMMRKGFQYEPLIYGGILALLLMLRISAVRRLFAVRP